MELTASVSKKNFIKQYINIFNGGLNLTQKEKEFLFELLLLYKNLEEEGLKEPYIGKIVFSRETLSSIKKKLKLSSQGLNNYKSQLKIKRIIKETSEGLQIDPKLIPQTTLTFNFIIHE